MPNVSEVQIKYEDPTGITVTVDIAVLVGLILYILQLLIAVYKR